MSKKVGVNCKMFVSATDTSYDEVELARDIDMGLDADPADGTSRKGGGIKEFESAMLEIKPSGEIIYDPSDSAWGILNAAFFARTPIYAKILDGGTDTSGKGVKGKFIVTSFSQSQPLGGVLVNKFTLAVNDGSCTGWQAGT